MVWIRERNWTSSLFFSCFLAKWYRIWKGGDFLEFTEKDSWRWCVVVLRNCLLLLDSAVSFVESQMKNVQRQAAILPLPAVGNTVDMGLCDLGLDVWVMGLNYIVASMTMVNNLKYYLDHCSLYPSLRSFWFVPLKLNTNILYHFCVTLCSTYYNLLRGLIVFHFKLCDW